MNSKIKIAQLIALFSICFVATSLIVSPYIAEAVTSSEYTGKCGFVSNPRHSAKGALTVNGQTADISTGGIVDMDNMTMYWSTTRMTLVVGDYDTFSQVPVSTTFTMRDDPEVPGAKEITFTVDGLTGKVRMIATGGGTAYIFQGKNLPDIGVCNKI